MPSQISYSPLETLLIFQSLISRDALSTAFDSVADALKANKFIREAPSFDVAKFTPDALKDLYLGYIRDEVRTQAAPVTQNGHLEGEDGQPGSKRRRLESPEIETIEDAEKYRNRLPGLVGQLYERYREVAVKKIREDEAQYRTIESEVETLEANELSTGESSIDSKPIDSHGDGALPTASNSKDSTAKPVPLTPLLNEGPTPTLRASSIPTTLEPKVAPGPQEQDSKIENSPLPMGLQPDQQIPPTYEAPASYGSQGHGPALGAPNYLPHEAGQIPPMTTSSFPSHPQTGRPDSSPAGSHPSRSPALLPPPQNMPLQNMPPLAPSSPSRHLGTTPEATGQRRTPSGQPPTPMPYYSPHQQQIHSMPSPSGYPPQYSPYQPQASPYGSPYPPPQYLPPHMTPRAWIPPPGTPQSQAGVARPIKAIPRQVSPYGSRGPPRAHPMSGTLPGQTFPGTPYGQADPYMMNPQYNTWSAPGRRETPRPPLLDTSFLSTPWKTPDPGFSSAVPTPGSPSRPEDISPISEIGESLFDAVGEKPRVTEKAWRGNRKGANRGRKQPSPTVQGSRQTHRGSTASTRSRSQSLISHQDDSHVPRSARSGPRKPIKREPPSTPAGVITEADDADTSSFSKDNTPRTTTRRRPTTLQTQTSDPAALTRTSKRKRDPFDSADFDDSPPVTATFPRPSLSSPNHVFTTKNFTRTCQPLMNEVTAHKHASIFAKPLTERDAPGYKDLIYRPQDLKSIKSAIHAGSRAVAAASEAVSTPVAGGDAGSPPSATTSKNNVLHLPKTTEVIPPKAIVNSAQLERELMRMFANAIMYNPTPERGFGPSFQLQRDIDWSTLSGDQEGTEINTAFIDSPYQRSGLGFGIADDGGVVRDSREMFDDVEKAVSNWRMAERGTLGLGIGWGRMSLDTPGNGEEGDGDADEGLVEGEAESVAEDTSVTGTLTGRKRRRVADA